jgi:hypothetical protein
MSIVLQLIGTVLTEQAGMRASLSMCGMDGLPHSH